MSGKTILTNPKKLVVLVDKSVDKTLRRMAFEMEVSKATLVRRAIKQLIEKQKGQKDETIED